MLDKTSSTYRKPLPEAIQDTEAVDCVFIDGLVIEASIGVYDEEKHKKQPVEISVHMYLQPLNGKPTLKTIVCYDTLTQKIAALVEREHIYLVETLAEEIAGICLAEPRVFRVNVSVGKPKAIEQARNVGVQITRSL